jgi:hypothetical protein
MEVLFADFPKQTRIWKAIKEAEAEPKNPDPYTLQRDFPSQSR